MADTNVAKHGRARNNNWYLKYAQAEHFGELSQRTLGPLGPQLNVVYGGNEAGKTSFVNLISGVMFGWEDGRTAKNTYKPINAERCGSLTFEKVCSWRAAESVQPDEASSEVAEGDFANNFERENVAQISRAKNSEGVKGDAWLLDDIEKETYRETFNLNSDKLMTMGDVASVTSRLLTASSGAPTAPTSVQKEIDRQIAEFTSNSAKHPQSVVRLQKRREDLQERINALLEEERSLAEDGVRLSRLISQNEKDRAEFAEMSARLEKLASASEIMRPVEDRREELSVDRDRQEDLQLPQFETEDFSDVPEKLVGITNREDDLLHERVRILASSLEKKKSEMLEAERSHELAEEECLAVQRDDKQNASLRRAATQAVRQAVLYGVTTLVFVVFGVIFSQVSSGQSSMGFSAITVGFLVCAVVFLVLFATRVVVAIKAKKAEPDEKEGTHRIRECERKREHELKELERAQAAFAAEERRVDEELCRMGLGDACGSTSEALFLLDRARNARLQKKIEDHAEEVAKDLAYYEQELAKCEAQRRAILEECGIYDIDEQSVEEARTATTARWQELSDSIEESNREIGRLEQRLRDSNTSQMLDALRLELEQVETRIGERMGQLAQALIAKKAIDAAIEQWEKASQPDVVAKAEHILSELTHKAWTGIHIGTSGEVEVSDRYGRKRAIKLLSTATCQQVYVSLRLALLETATFVGRNVPVMCDDILVHFDWSRRSETARFLAHLARTRQVIVFTCHEEVAELLTRVDPECTLIRL